MKTADIAPISLSRRELYDLVWSVPVPEAAARLGISRTWLTKICSRARVPYPTRAWWALAASGKAPPRTRLGQVKVEDVIILRPRGRMRSGPLDAHDGGAGEPEDLIDLPDRLIRLHPVLTAWRLQLWHELERSRREPWRRAGAAPAALGKRRMRLLDALLKALERRGHAIEACLPFSEHLGLALDGRRVEMMFREDDLPNPDQDRSEDAARAKPWLASAPAAALSLEVRAGLEAVQASRWSDHRDARLEDQLTDILAAISDMARAPDRPGAWPYDGASGTDLAGSGPDALGWLALSRAAANWDAIDRVRRFLARLAGSAAPLTPAEAAWLAWAEAQALRREADHARIDKVIATTRAVMTASGEDPASTAPARPQNNARRR